MAKYFTEPEPYKSRFGQVTPPEISDSMLQQQVDGGLLDGIKESAISALSSTPVRFGIKVLDTPRILVTDIIGNQIEAWKSLWSDETEDDRKGFWKNIGEIFTDTHKDIFTLELDTTFTGEKTMNYLTNNKHKDWHWLPRLATSIGIDILTDPTSFLVAKKAAEVGGKTALKMATSKSAQELSKLGVGLRAAQHSPVGRFYVKDIIGAARRSKTEAVKMIEDLAIHDPNIAEAIKNMSTERNDMRRVIQDLLTDPETSKMMGNNAELAYDLGRLSSNQADSIVGQIALQESGNFKEVSTRLAALSEQQLRDIGVGIVKDEGMKHSVDMAKFIKAKGKWAYGYRATETMLKSAKAKGYIDEALNITEDVANFKLDPKDAFVKARELGFKFEAKQVLAESNPQSYYWAFTSELAVQGGMNPAMTRFANNAARATGMGWYNNPFWWMGRIYKTEEALRTKMLGIPSKYGFFPDDVNIQTMYGPTNTGYIKTLTDKLAQANPILRPDADNPIERMMGQFQMFAKLGKYAPVADEGMNTINGSYAPLGAHAEQVLFKHKDVIERLGKEDSNDILDFVQMDRDVWAAYRAMDDMGINPNIMSKMLRKQAWNTDEFAKLSDGWVSVKFQERLNEYDELMSNGDLDWVASVRNFFDNVNNTEREIGVGEPDFVSDIFKYIPASITDEVFEKMEQYIPADIMKLETGKSGMQGRDMLMRKIRPKIMRDLPISLINRTAKRNGKDGGKALDELGFLSDLLGEGSDASIKRAALQALSEMDGSIFYSELTPLMGKRVKRHLVDSWTVGITRSLKEYGGLAEIEDSRMIHSLDPTIQRLVKTTQERRAKEIKGFDDRIEGLGASIDEGMPRDAALIKTRMNELEAERVKVRETLSGLSDDPEYAEWRSAQSRANSANDPVRQAEKREALAQTEDNDVVREYKDLLQKSTDIGKAPIIPAVKRGAFSARVVSNKQRELDGVIAKISEARKTEKRYSMRAARGKATDADRAALARVQENTQRLREKRDMLYREVQEYEGKVDQSATDLNRAEQLRRINERLVSLASSKEVYDWNNARKAVEEIPSRAESTRLLAAEKQAKAQGKVSGKAKSAPYGKRLGEIRDEVTKLKRALEKTKTIADLQKSKQAVLDRTSLSPQEISKISEREGGVKWQVEDTTKQALLKLKGYAVDNEGWVKNVTPNDLRAVGVENVKTPTGHNVKVSELPDVDNETWWARTLRSGQIPEARSGKVAVVLRSTLAAIMENFQNAGFGDMKSVGMDRIFNYINKCPAGFREFSPAELSDIYDLAKLADYNGVIMHEMDSGVHAGIIDSAVKLREASYHNPKGLTKFLTDASAILQIDKIWGLSTMWSNLLGNAVYAVQAGWKPTVQSAKYLKDYYKIHSALSKNPLLLKDKAFISQFRPVEGLGGMTMLDVYDQLKRQGALGKGWMIAPFEDIQDELAKVTNNTLTKPRKSMSGFNKFKKGFATPAYMISNYIDNAYRFTFAMDGLERRGWTMEEAVAGTKNAFGDFDAGKYTKAENTWGKAVLFYRFRKWNVMQQARVLASDPKWGAAVSKVYRAHFDAMDKDEQKAAELMRPSFMPYVKAKRVENVTWDKNGKLRSAEYAIGNPFGNWYSPTDALEFTSPLTAIANSFIFSGDVDPSRNGQVEEVLNAMSSAKEGIAYLMRGNKAESWKKFTTAMGHATNFSRIGKYVRPMIKNESGEIESARKILALQYKQYIDIRDVVRAAKANGDKQVWDSANNAMDRIDLLYNRMNSTLAKESHRAKMYPQAYTDRPIDAGSLWAKPAESLKYITNAVAFWN